MGLVDDDAAVLGGIELQMLASTVRPPGLGRVAHLQVVGEFLIRHHLDGVAGVGREELLPVGVTEARRRDDEHPPALRLEVKLDESASRECLAEPDAVRDQNAAPAVEDPECAADPEALELGELQRRSGRPGQLVDLLGEFGAVQLVEHPQVDGVRVVVDLPAAVEAGEVEGLGLLPQVVVPRPGGGDLVRRIGTEVEFEVVQQAAAVKFAEPARTPASSPKMNALPWRNSRRYIRTSVVGRSRKATSRSTALTAVWRERNEVAIRLEG